MSEPFGVEDITVVQEPVYVTVESPTHEAVQLTNETVYVTVDSVTETVVIEGAPVVNSTPSPMQELSDVISSIEAYVGYAVPGTLPSAPAWHICHVMDTSDGPVTTWARGESGSLFNLVWDDRLSYAWS